ncbi:MAG: glycosyltransferase family 4 protein [Bacteroidales bacterium]|nr:glycosyltransferase family 4 protein [Bacteroidales bacterium]
MNIYVTYLIIAAILVAAELVYFRIADRFNIIDKPNERSSHTKVVLRGGGIIFVLGMWIYAAFFGAEMWPFLLGLTLVAGISFVDDIHSLPDSVRLVVQFVAMFLMFYQWNVLNWESWWIVLAALILCVGITNAYNFMDGINGINGVYTLAVLLPLAWLNNRLSFVDQRLIVVALLADLVFCWFNFRPKGKAKCFAGDVGSVGAAFIVVFVLGLLILRTGDFTYIVFLAVYGVDAVLTIVHRIMLHENLGEAHRKHAYQIMANELGMEHTVVSSVYMLLQLAISVGMILVPATAAWHWGYLIVVCLLLVGAYVVFMKKYYHLHTEYLKSLEKKDV